MQELLQRFGVGVDVTFNLIFFGLIWIRCLAMASVIPFLFGKPVPRYLVVGASMVLAIFAYPHLVPLSPPELSENLLNLFMLYLKEAFYGFSIGIAASIIFYGFEAAGAMIDNQRGVSIARVLIPQLGEQGSLSGSFLFQLAIVIYLTLGGHHAFFDAFFGSYQILPVLEFPTAGLGMLPLIYLFIEVTGIVFLVAVQLAAPVIIAIFLADIILGIANRVAPQINVWELGFNVKGYIGVLLLFISLTMVIEQIEHYTLKANEYAAKVVERLEKKPEQIEVPDTTLPEEGLPQSTPTPPTVISP